MLMTRTIPGTPVFDGDAAQKGLGLNAMCYSFNSAENRAAFIADEEGYMGRFALTDRQRDCLIWAARGKGDWEISRILGISEETVAQHIRQACERYGVQKRTSLMIHALFDGTISFADVAPH